MNSSPLFGGPLGKENDENSSFSGEISFSLGEDFSHDAPSFSAPPSFSSSKKETGFSPPPSSSQNIPSEDFDFPKGKIAFEETEKTFHENFSTPPSLEDPSLLSSSTTRENASGELPLSSVETAPFSKSSPRPPSSKNISHSAFREKSKVSPLSVQKKPPFSLSSDRVVKSAEPPKVYSRNSFVLSSEKPFPVSANRSPPSDTTHTPSHSNTFFQDHTLSPSKNKTPFPDLPPPSPEKRRPSFEDATTLPPQKYSTSSLLKNSPTSLAAEKISSPEDEVFFLRLLDAAREVMASDLHITAGELPKIRLGGEIETLSGFSEISEKQVSVFLHITMAPDIREEFFKTKDSDYSFVDQKKRRYRANAMQSMRGAIIILRLISDHILTFEELALPESVKQIAHYKKGLVVVTGPSGCGKTTTLASLVNLINQTDDGHLLTIEDPVEILHYSQKSLVNQREVKKNTHSFARALKSALREDPDTIVVGEMRDYETISLAMTAAETGHLVFGTLHTSSAAKTITRIIDAFPAGEQGQIRIMLAEGIQCVVSQVLCRRKDGNGQVAAYEVLFGTTAIRSLIRENKIHQIPSTIEIGLREGMITLDQSLKKLVVDNIITKEEAISYAANPNLFG